LAERQDGWTRVICESVKGTDIHLKVGLRALMSSDRPQLRFLVCRPLRSARADTAYISRFDLTKPRVGLATAFQNFE
jgi:hypothetical protein